MKEQPLDPPWIDYPDDNDLPDVNAINREMMRREDEADDKRKKA